MGAAAAAAAAPPDVVMCEVRWLVIAAAAAHSIQCTSVHSDKAYGNTRRLHFAPSSLAARQGLPDRVHNTL